MIGWAAQVCKLCRLAVPHARSAGARVHGSLATPIDPSAPHHLSIHPPIHPFRCQVQCSTERDWDQVRRQGGKGGHKGPDAAAWCAHGKRSVLQEGQPRSQGYVQGRQPDRVPGRDGRARRHTGRRVRPLYPPLRCLREPNSFEGESRPLRAPDRAPACAALASHFIVMLWRR